MAIPWTALVSTAIAAAAVLTAAAAEPPRLSGGYSAEAGRSAPSDRADGDGRLGADDELVEARLFWRPHPAVRIGLGLGVDRTGYDGDDAPATVRQAWARLPLTLMASHHWGMTSQSSIGSGGAAGVGWAEGRQWQVQAGPVWVRDDDLIVALLVNVSSRHGRSPSVFAFPSVHWRFREAWRLTVVDEVDNVSRLAWRARGDLDLGLRLDVRLREYVLDDDRVLVDDHVGLAAEAAWRPFADETLALAPFAGALLWRRLEERDADGHEFASTTVRPALLAGLGLRGRF